MREEAIADVAMLTRAIEQRNWGKVLSQDYARVAHTSVDGPGEESMVCRFHRRRPIVVASEPRVTKLPSS